jgi:plasmid stability protein
MLIVRTTIDIPDAMYRRLKARAAKEGRPAKALILQGVEQILTPERSPAAREVRLPLVRSKRPGTLRLDNARIYDVISFP